MSPPPSKSQLVIFDTNIIIRAFETNSWTSLIKNYSVTIGETIKGESLFYRDEHGNPVPIDLEPFIKAGEIKVISLPARELDAFKKDFNPVYQERLDPGELEILCYFKNHAASETLICSADGIVFKILGKWRTSDRGISLEELLKKIGYSKPLPERFTKAFRERYSREGFRDS